MGTEMTAVRRGFFQFPDSTLGSRILPLVVALAFLLLSAAISQLPVGAAQTETTWSGATQLPGSSILDLGGQIG